MPYRDGPITDQDANHPQQWQPACRDALHQLREYEGRHGYLPYFTGLLISGAAFLIPPAVLAIAVFVVAGQVASYLVGLASLATGGLPAWALKSKLWERRTLNRWNLHQQYDPHLPRLTVNIPEQDAERVGSIVRRAGLVLEYSRISYGGADPKNYHLAVAQWAHAPALDEATFRSRVTQLFEAAGIWANVSGTEVNPPTA